MVSSLISVRELIIDAFCLGVPKEFFTRNSECPSLAEARAFMERHRFEGAALEELANAIQAEAILCVDDHQANLALVAEGVICSDLIPEPTDDKKMKICVDDHRANLALEAEGVLLSDLTPEPTDYETRDHSEDCTKLGDDLTSTVVTTMRQVEISKIDSADVDENRDNSEDRTNLGDESNSQLVERLPKDAIESHDQKVSAGGVLANATSDDVNFFAAEDPQMPRAVQACFLSPELLPASVPAAPNISYQRSLPTIDDVKFALTAGPNVIACMCVNIITPQHTASCCQSFQGDVSSRYRPYSRSPDSEEILEKTTCSIECGSQLLRLFLFFSKHLLLYVWRKKVVLVELVL